MVRIAYTFLLILFTTVVTAQEFLYERITAWEKAGTTEGIEAPSNQVLITDYGADNLGYSYSDEAYDLAIESLNEQAGTIVFPEGNYLFSNTLVVPDSVFLKGVSSETELIFDLDGAGHLIRMSGSLSSTEYALEQAGLKGAVTIALEDAAGIQAGDIIKLGMFDEDHMTSSWAYGTLGQLVKVLEINGNTLVLMDPLTHHYPLWREPFIQIQNPITNAGIECVSIKREDATTSQTSNIYIQHAFNCVVRNVTSEDCNFGHVDIRTSSHVAVEGSYFHHAHAYGGGGQGYGVVVHSTSSFCLVQNNIFEHLRHSMLLQSAANGNVFGYNYSYDPYWEDGFLPANSAGDAVLHGNYTFLNLFEGNTVQHIVIDASHGSNGPYNTFFRNRAELYGFFSDPNTVTDSMNVVGNEITNSGWPYGLFMLNGAGHYSYGNNHSGTATPPGTEQMSINSLYLNEIDLPDALDTETLPMIGFPLDMNEKLLPAEVRFDDQEYVNCEVQVVTDVSDNQADNLLLTAEGRILKIDRSLLPATIEIYSLDGTLVHSENVSNTEYPFYESLSNAVYLVRASNSRGISESLIIPLGW